MAPVPPPEEPPGRDPERAAAAPAATPVAPAQLKVIALGTAIGRGHPHYLALAVRQLRLRLVPGGMLEQSVFSSSRGFSRLAWRALRASYHVSAQNATFIELYNRLRRNQPVSPRSLSLRILGRDLRRWLTGFPGICLVEHQLTARMVSDVCRTWYLHGDIAAPPECATTGAERVLVPLEFTAQKLRAAGARPEQLICTGLMIEPELAATAHEDFHRRLSRLESTAPLTVAFFSSGAWPAPHIRKIILGVESVLQSGLRAIVFCAENRAFRMRVLRLAQSMGITPEPDDGQTAEHRTGPPASPLVLVSRPDRESDTVAAVRYLPEVDVFVAPAHERVQWAVGLGLPLFVLFPMIGTHARMNYDFAFDNCVAYPLARDQDARNLGATVCELRQRRVLTTMCRTGFGRFELNGPQRIAEAVLTALR